MKKTILLLIFFFSVLIWPKQTSAQLVEPMECGFKIRCIDPPDCLDPPFSRNIRSDTQKAEFSFDLGTIPEDVWDSMPIDFFDNSQFYTSRDQRICKNYSKTDLKKDSVITDTFTRTSSCAPFDPSTQTGGLLGENRTYYLKYNYNHTGDYDLCFASYSITESYSADITIEPIPPLYDVDSSWKITIANVNPKTYRGRYGWNRNVLFRAMFKGESLNNGSKYLEGGKGDLKAGGNKADSPPVSFTLKPLPVGTHTIEFVRVDNGETIKSATFEVIKRGAPTPTPSPTFAPTPTWDPNLPTPTFGPPVPNIVPICESLDPQFIQKCKDCVDVKGGIWSAIGCLPIDFEAIIKDYVFDIGLGIAGVTSFLYFLYGTFLILTSAGNAERVAQAKEIIMSALSGLILIIFSVFLLKIIGVDILKLPGFN